jgi:hypothetical protein
VRAPPPGRVHQLKLFVPLSLMVVVVGVVVVVVVAVVVVVVVVVSSTIGQIGLTGSLVHAQALARLPRRHFRPASIALASVIIANT